MQILFINAHRATQQGNLRFGLYHKQIKKILKSTIYYGNQITQIIKTKSQLQQFIFDQITYQCNPKNKQIFNSIEYVFIDGQLNILPWTKGYQTLLVFMRNCLKNNKKIHCNGFAHFAAYYQLTTNFDKPYFICPKQKVTEQNQKKVDYQYDSQTGDLSFRGKKISNSGLKLLKQTKRPFSAKSKQAVNNGIVLPTKYHYVIFNSKNGQKILKNITFPFTFYWKSNILCTQKSISKAKANILVQTQLGSPFAFTYNKCLSTQGLSSQFLQIIQNWINQSIGKLEQSQNIFQFGLFQTMNIDNKLNMNINQNKKIKNNQQYYDQDNDHYQPEDHQLIHLHTNSNININHNQNSNINHNSNHISNQNSHRKLKKNQFYKSNSNYLHPNTSIFTNNFNNNYTPTLLTSNKSNQSLHPSRPLSSKYNNSTINFQKSTVRCGDVYQTQQQKYKKFLKQSKLKNIGPSRMTFKGKLQQKQIKNYVNLTPGRPVTAHKYRQIDKNKWMAQRNFFLS